MKIRNDIRRRRDIAYVVDEVISVDIDMYVLAERH